MAASLMTNYTSILHTVYGIPFALYVYEYRLYKHIHYHSKVWGHPDNFVFSMKAHTFIYQMSCKMNRKYSQDIDKVRNNDFYLKY